ncbi:transcriptional regulator [Citrifermentans bremense]|uniref:transcriptional regulator n=1 Tax=Citrifermentans bremense TaxID=60035 RepID=UPI000401EE4A|nr:transcriptional regulator [Citrifermentans bremense]
MRSRPKGPRVPPDRRETVRHETVSLLTGENMTAREISGQVGIGEKEVLEHLEHIRIALRGRLVVTPPACLECGFSFRKRERLGKPGRCPVCRSERIVDPSYTIG